MFSKILVANRGEIACRVIKTARKMGIRTVAVYSDADRDALHVEMADEAVGIGPPAASQSYLAIDKIVAACKATGAQAVHPGYGFLSERAAFPTALAAAGIVFIGPQASAIEAMGDKIRSKQFAKAAKVSTVPGFLGVIEDEDHAVRIADEIGYPVMIKASAGGGGKGMRIAHSAAEVGQGFARARSEALSSFGDDRMFIEKFIVNPRHIEIQVLGDKHGNIIHLGERECSIQRRNQKVIEEAPSPLLDAETRRAIGTQAVALAKAVNYDSAGTIEFVAAQDKSFFFLEMNTRLQVEHPVTELVTGLDLVEEMIRIAAGETLRLRQEDVTWKGWAVESRVYAEDPTRDFLPSIGRLTTYRLPAEGRVNGITVRNDTGVTEGREISIHYDPMIAKLVTHAPTRLAAIDAQSRALDGFVIEGVRNNIPFLSRLMVHPRWRDGRLSTGFIAEEFPQGFASEAPTGETELKMTAIAAHIDHVLLARKRTISGQLEPPSNMLVGEDRVAAIGKKQAAFKTSPGSGNGITFQCGDRVFVVESGWRPGDIVWTGTVDAESLVAQVRSVLNGVHLSHAGASADFRIFSGLEAELVKLMPERPAAESSGQLLCPMPGTVQKVFVIPGQKVRAGEALLVVEAMKMENVLRAERDGTVSSLFVTAGDNLAVDAVILEIA